MTRPVIERVAFLTGLLLLWALASRIGPWPRYLFPGPVAVAASLGEMIADGRLGAAVVRSLSRLGQGYFLSALIGVPLGIANARWLADVSAFVDESKSIGAALTL